MQACPALARVIKPRRFANFSENDGYFAACTGFAEICGHGLQGSANELSQGHAAALRDSALGL
jgi:hypothetical protein